MKIKEYTKTFHSSTARIEIHLNVEDAVIIGEIGEKEGRSRKGQIEYLVKKRIEQYVIEKRKELNVLAVKAVRQKKKK